MDEIQSLSAANTVSIIRFTQEYLENGPFNRRKYQFGDLFVYASKVANRTGVHDADTFLYWFEHPNWQLKLRAVWRGGELMCPLATHTVVIAYLPPEGSDESATQPELMARVNDWLLKL